MSNIIRLLSVQEVQEEGKNAIDSPGNPMAPTLPPEEYALGEVLSWQSRDGFGSNTCVCQSFKDENEERSMVQPGSLDDPKLRALIAVLVDWINDELAEHRIIVQNVDEDLYDGQVLQKLLGNVRLKKKSKHRRPQFIGSLYCSQRSWLAKNWTSPKWLSLRRTKSTNWESFWATPIEWVLYCKTARQISYCQTANNPTIFLRSWVWPGCPQPAGVWRACTRRTWYPSCTCSSRWLANSELPSGSLRMWSSTWWSSRNGTESSATGSFLRRSLRPTTTWGSAASAMPSTLYSTTLRTNSRWHSDHWISILNFNFKFVVYWSNALRTTQVVKKSLVTFVNKQLNKIHLEVTDLDSQFHDGVFLTLLMGLLEGYFVPLHEFFLTPKDFDQKVHNVSFAFELMQDSGLPKPKARPEGDFPLSSSILLFNCCIFK